MTGQANASSRPDGASSKYLRTQLMRSIGAVVAGLLFVVVATTVVDQLFHATGIFPPWGAPMLAAGPNLLALSYRILLGVAGGYLTASLAPGRETLHAVILGLTGTIFGLVGAVGMAEMSPLWFLVAVVAATLPSAWLGGRLAIRRAGF